MDSTARHRCLSTVDRLVLERGELDPLEFLLAMGCLDYADYRDVNGLKVPFRWTFSWLDGQDTFELSDVKFNVPVDAAKFGEPNPLPGK